MPPRTPDPAEIEALLRTLALRRGPGKTYCPSEAARILAADWRPLMPHIRAAAVRLHRTGLLRATQKGRPVDPQAVRGPIRLGLPPEDPREN